MGFDYNPYTGNDALTVFSSNMERQGSISPAGMFNFDVGTPTELLPLTNFETDLLGTDITFAPADARGVFLELSIGKEYLLIRQEATLTVLSFFDINITVEAVGYVYVDRDLVMKGTIPFDTGTGTGTRPVNFELLLKRGWNAIHQTTDYISGNMQLSIGNPNHLKWVITEQF